MGPFHNKEEKYSHNGCACRHGLFRGMLVQKKGKAKMNGFKDPAFWVAVMIVSAPWLMFAVGLVKARRKWVSEQDARSRAHPERMVEGLSFREGNLPLEGLQKSGIVPYTRSHSMGWFEGAYKGAAIRYAKVKLDEVDLVEPSIILTLWNFLRAFARVLEKDKDPDIKPPFYGAIAQIRFPTQKFFGRTLLEERRLAPLRRLRESELRLQHADLVDPVFMQEFEVFTSDQVEARYLLDPAMMERIRALAKLNPEGPLAIACYDNQVLIMVSTPPFEPLPPREAELQRETAEFFKLIDYLALYQPRQQA